MYFVIFGNDYCVLVLNVDFFDFFEDGIVSVELLFIGNFEFSFGIDVFFFVDDFLVVLVLDLVVVLM